MRLKFTGKTLLVKNRNGPLYQEKFYVRSKFRCKSVSQLCLGIFMDLVSIRKSVRAVDEKQDKVIFSEVVD